MKITDLKCAVIGQSPVIRITTDEGIDGFGEIERVKTYIKPQVLFYRDLVLGEDPTNVESVMLKIRQLGGYKPWGSAVSAIEIALWDVAGKAAGIPVYKLLGGKIRDKVRPYLTGTPGGMRDLGIMGRGNIRTPDDCREAAHKVKECKEGFTITKQGMNFIGIARQSRDYTYSQYYDQFPSGGNMPFHPAAKGRVRGPVSERGLEYAISCMSAWKEILGDEIGLAAHGDGWLVPDAIKVAKALEPLNVVWFEDSVGGDYIPYSSADKFREVTRSTSTPIHTGEQIYLRQHFQELIEKHAVRIVAPDPEDCGGIAEMKWIAEYADLHGILIAPHGIFDGLIGNAAQVMAGAAMPDNYIAFEYSFANPEWWYDIINESSDLLVKDGFIEVWDRPGLGVTFNKPAAKKYLKEEDKGFFD